MSEFAIDVREENGTTVIAPKGRINTATAAELQAKVDGIPSGTAAVDFDFAGVDHISSAGLRVIAAADERIQETGGKLRILNANAVVREIFNMTGFTSILTIV